MLGLPVTLKGPKYFSDNFQMDLVVLMYFARMNIKSSALIERGLALQALLCT